LKDKTVRLEYYKIKAVFDSVEPKWVSVQFWHFMHSIMWH